MPTTLDTLSSLSFALGTAITFSVSAFLVRLGVTISHSISNTNTMIAVLVALLVLDASAPHCCTWHSGREAS